ncbi:hypothetical protein BUALT_Bualt19G0034300 [Buddleja alternifolia]|uniref:Uncharacterized protein n=1 Tax=Buddleja alternifolia TaxID=168488 RepID=A0AAV6VZR2_9LAMI|nr:hypothetical protein BUALT_Bualt19G0034300 [Buddleja alternifolia]
MASLLHCSAAPASQSILPLRRPFAGVHSSATALFTPGRPNLKPHLNLRFKKEIRVQVKKRWSPVFASNANSSDGSNDTKTSDNAQGPPFLTILAGLVVFSVICWIIGSIVMWIIGLIVHPPPLK